MRHKKRLITGWRYDNPPEVERAFRRGFLAGVLLGLAASDDDILGKHDHAARLRHLLYWGRWSDVRAARLRGISHGLRYLRSCRQAGRSASAWIKRVRAWSEAEIPEVVSRDDRAEAMPPEPARRAAILRKQANCTRVDLPGLFRRIALVTGIPESYVCRQGAWLVRRSWRLHVCVDKQFRYRGQQRWLPGIAVMGCDPQGRFGRYEFFTFDEFTTAHIDVPRVEAFLRAFAWARKKAMRRRSARRRKGQRTTGRDLSIIDKWQAGGDRPNADGTHALQAV